MASPMPQPKFKVIKALGKGSYGTVYKVQRLEDGGVYAMKETDMSRMGAKERADAVNEIRVLGSMKHPNVVRHHETFVSGAKLCIVMEFAPAGDLASFLKAAAATRLPLPEATVWQVFLQLCQGMQAIHETCVIHRDIKPANIFMCPDNVVKIGDLGVAKALTKASHAQTVIGTPLYMAPEVWRGLKYSYSSDLWSLGGVLYEMMTHRLPFDARSLNELKSKIIMGGFTPLAPGAPYSAGLVAVAHALLSKDPRKRPTCAAILNSREAAPWLHTLPEPVRLPLPALDAGPGLGPSVFGPAPDAPHAVAPQLLPTIQVPRDIRLLPHRLPKPDYGGDNGDAAPAAGSGNSPPSNTAPPAAVPARAMQPGAAAAAAAPPRVSQAAAPIAVMGRPGVAAAAAAAAGVRPPSGSRAGVAHQAAVAAGVVGGVVWPRVPVAMAGVAPPRQPSPRSYGSPAPGAVAAAAAGCYKPPPGAFRAASPGGGAGGARAAFGAGAAGGAPLVNNNINIFLKPAGAPPGAHVPSAGRVAAAAAGVPAAGIGAGKGGIGAAAGGQMAGMRPAGRPSAAPAGRPAGGWPY